MRAPPRVCAILVLLLTAAVAFAEGTDPMSFIGMDLPAAVGALGLPQRMLVVRGSDDTRDTVVFYFATHQYLFWFKDRVWQVRWDRRSAVSVLGLTMGMGRDQVQFAVPGAFQAIGDSLYVDISGRGYPVRARLVFEAGALADIYLYRSDF